MKQESGKISGFCTQKETCWFGLGYIHINNNTRLILKSGKECSTLEDRYYQYSIYMNLHPLFIYCKYTSLLLKVLSLHCTEIHILLLKKVINSTNDTKQITLIVFHSSKIYTEQTLMRSTS
jgi:hypothetical protein